jgi:hypothetical protein
VAGAAIRAGDRRADRDVGGKGDTTLAVLLGDDELLARAAAMDVCLPPRATVGNTALGSALGPDLGPALGPTPGP